HLDDHLTQLPEEDIKSRAILEQMREDEIEHGQQALEAGGAVFPEPIKQAMVLLSKVMTKATYKA
ncbi:MAG: demethoxyubiquinone hydroxylase family protein, partial [Halopseudomonas aestusnigri]|nr:demethoxyubiquinone hydroxylase family protein [Halopseudomonas aestusnigri]